MPNKTIHYPAIIHYQGDDELVYIKNQKTFLQEAQHLYLSFQPQDRLIDSNGQVFTLTLKKNETVKIKSTNQHIPLANFEQLVKNHLSVMNQCCISKVQLSNFKQGFALIAQLFITTSN